MRRLLSICVALVAMVTLCSSCVSYRNLFYDLGEFRFTVVDINDQPLDYAIVKSVLSPHKNGNYKKYKLTLTPLVRCSNGVGVLSPDVKMKRRDFFVVEAGDYKLVKIPYRKGMDRDIKVVLEIDSTVFFLGF